MSTLRQCAANAIAAVQTASTIFAMAAMLGRKPAQLKMPRPDAYRATRQHLTKNERERQR